MLKLDVKKAEMKKLIFISAFLIFAQLTFADNNQLVDFEYAKRIEIKRVDGVTYITIPKAYYGATKGLKYCLIPKKLKKLPDVKGYTIIRTPVRRIIALSTTMLPYLDKLEALEHLVAIDRIKYVNTESVVKRFNQKKILEVGSTSHLDIELIYDLKPDLVLTFATGSKFDTHQKLKTANISYMLTCSYLEDTLLGRSEWIKLFGLLLGYEKKSNEVFEEIKKKYLHLKKVVEKIETQPSVFCNAPYKGVWYSPGGTSWIANAFKDSKVKYKWAENDSFTALRLNFEQVFDRALDADYWLCSSSIKWKTLKDVEKTDNRFKHFNAFKKGNIFINNKMVNKKGGNAFFEKGVVEPDLILCDFIKIFHPNLLKERPFTFYNKIDQK